MWGVLIGTPPPSGWRFDNPAPRVTTVEQPAAGTDWVYDLPQNRLVSVGAVTAKLVTSTAVANRRPKLRVKDATGHIVVSIPVTTAITASSTRWISWGRSMGAAFLSGSHEVSSLPEIILPPNCTIGTTTTAIAAGDQWSTVVLLLEVI